MASCERKINFITQVKSIENAYSLNQSKSMIEFESN
jgi:hypothetical protein